MQLAVIDNHPPAWGATLAPFLEMLGYSRYWTTEQHARRQSGSPIVLAAAAGARCKRMRVGTAGVMLKINGLHRVLADFKALQFLYPGRLDMGFIAQAPAEPLSSKLSSHPPADFADSLRQLVALVRGESRDADDHVEAGSLLPVEVWLCGSSPASARLAAELGICYAYHDNRYVSGPATSPRPLPFRGTPFTEPARAYLDEFRPHAQMADPRLCVACYGTCAETTAAAESSWAREAGLDREGRRWPAGFCGGPDDCREQLLAMQHAYGAHELAVQTLNRDLTGCLTSYSLLAAGCVAAVDLDDAQPARALAV